MSKLSVWPKLHLATEKGNPTTERLARIYFKNNCAYASNGQLLARFDLENRYEQELINHLNGKSISRKMSEMMSKANHMEYNFDSEAIELNINDVQLNVNFLDEEYWEGPDFEAIVSKSGPQPTKSLCLKNNLVETMGKVMASMNDVSFIVDYSFLHLGGTNNPIRMMNTENQSMVLLMPLTSDSTAEN